MIPGYTGPDCTPDKADEITAYTKNNILLQAAQSMLSQSNAMPQGVLSMLQ